MMKRLMELNIEQQTQIFQIMYLGLLFTIAVMFSIMIMNVIAERDFELATLRVLVLD